MSLYKNIFVRSLLPIADRLMKTEFSQSLNMIFEMNSWSSGEIEQWQNIKLQNLVKHAYENTSYYRNLFDRMKFRPEDVRTKSDLSALPILKKKDILQNPDDFIPRNINRIKYINAATGGTSGDPLQFLLDYRSKSFGTACSVYYWNKFGYKYGQKYIALGSSSLSINNKISLKKRIYNNLRGRISLNGIGLTDEVLNEYVSLIKREKIHFIYGYASSIFLLAEFVIIKSIKINQIKACFTTSEVLTDYYRTVIKSAFNCDILDCYGASDGGVTAFEIKANLYRVGYNCIVEVHESYAENTGKILCTDLFNYAMPFIRYELGDEIRLAPSSEGDGYNGQIISEIFGRTSDVFRLGNGRVLTGPGFTVLFKDINVKAYHIELTGPLEISVEIIKKNSFNTKDENTIVSTFKKHAGHDCNIILKFVDSIEYSGSGKSRFFYSG